MDTPSGNSGNLIQIFALAGNMIVTCLFLYYFKFQYTISNYIIMKNAFN